MKFNEIKKDIELEEYLKKVTSRTGGKEKKERYLYHYTSIKNLNKIVSSGMLKFSNAETTNDKFEANCLKSFGLNKKLFYISFTDTQDESFPMWKIYSKEDGVRIGIPYDICEKMVSQKITTKNGKEINGEYKLFLSQVCYFKKQEKYIYVKNKCNTRIQNALDSKRMAGLVKYSCWDYEDEVRMIVELKDKTNEDIYISIKDLLNNRKTKIIFQQSPFFDRNKNIKLITNLAKKNINLIDSAYKEDVNLEYFR